MTLHRGSKGFGFVLRGAKDSSPLLQQRNPPVLGGTTENASTKTSSSNPQAAPPPPPPNLTFIGLQYFDEIEAAGVADAAGIKRGDYLLAVNEVDVRHMSHENAVQLIRQSGDRVTMTIATHVPKQLVSILKKKGAAGAATGKTSTPKTSAEQMSSSQSAMLSSSHQGGIYGTGKGKAPPPAPPKRDPSTTLTTSAAVAASAALASRTRARSLVVPSEVRTAHSLMTTAADDGAQKLGKEEDRCASPSSSVDSMARGGGGGGTLQSPSRGGKVASIRAHSSRRISSYELNDFMSRQTAENAQQVAKVCEFFLLTFVILTILIY